ncbi:HD domain-containing phosphohydrolase [Magnetofaba australis]|uniref:Putative response regulator receiver modulated metal dependent phosphohydrolase n=1 Tax=Magnetofaba australis IT-1 TaxID=1434232 RepID=A0A1Y2K4P5_9PROT|nr:HD domain-containing phosphohydrolase [Magnetofaba australis]OSM03974.1 putative response regulator receiver modulated metal dependent phosphohydrolase [Magnetofaba australis IT-1]
MQLNDAMEAEILASRIMIVDDNPANVALLEAMLQAEGFDKVYGVEDPREAVSLFETQSWDLLLLDIRMPVLDGYAVMAALRRTVGEAEYLPVLALTAQTDAETRHRALREGAQDFLSKPFDNWEVMLRARNMLRSRIYFKRQKMRAELLDAQVNEKTAEINETRLEVIRRLGKAGEFRDDQTGAHVLRMSHSCQLLALRIGLSEAQSRDILYASPMHDVGKIGISDTILLKPGRLDDQEMALMREHVVYGLEILGDHPAELFQLARQIIAGHHERWDGAGYPHGWAGEAIPLAARIASVCDVYDALTSVRPYKKAWSVEDAAALIRDGAGQQFDPQLATAFLEILPQVEALKAEFGAS